MQLSPLQSRLAASVAASIILLILAFTLLPGPKLAFAADVINVPRVIYDDLEVEDAAEVERRDAVDGLYKPVFAAFDRSLIGRQTESNVAELNDNVPVSFTLKPGEVGYYMFQSGRVTSTERLADIAGLVPREESGPERDTPERDVSETAKEDLGRRVGTRPVFISANTCIQPQRGEGAAITTSPLQLRFLVSADSNEQLPNRTKSTTQAKVFDEGAVIYKMDSTGVVYFGIEAPVLPDGFAGDWGFEIVASTEGWYHTYEDGDSDDSLLHTVANDGSGVLLMTRDLAENEDEHGDGDGTQTIMDSAPPFALFAAPSGSSTFDGVRNSFCGLRNYAQIVGMHDADHANKISVSMTTRGHGNRPKQQFWLSGLNSNTKYSGILVRTGRNPMLEKRQNRGGNNGGVQVLQQTDFETQTGDNCRVIANLDFCDQTQYAVPANLERFDNVTMLANFYDNYAKTMYDNFQKVLMQIPCEADSDARYSLARTCADCDRAYKQWLCMVAIPRCEDISSDNPFAIIRAANFAFPNGTTLPTDEIQRLADALGPAVTMSRNSITDEQVRPGPYKEVLPCEDLCYQLVQSCPSSMQFNCPLRNNPFFNSSYGVFRGDGVPSCNKPPNFTATSSAETGYIMSSSAAFVAIAALVLPLL